MLIAGTDFWGLNLQIMRLFYLVDLIKDEAFFLLLYRTTSSLFLLAFARQPLLALLKTIIFFALHACYSRLLFVF